MEIRELAERVLLATTLEEKLAIPMEALSDEHPGQAITVPDAPGRPDTLCFQPGFERVPMPSVVELEDEQDRGVLLHFFGNHELLAAELMALVLLRFPDAPPEFRLGVAQTLRDEQAHTRLYMRRMEACGVTFGSQPVNSFFWRVVSSMQTPVDYVARLSLTFEQANLDFARHFAGVFKRAGDTATARILDKIYHDEINHVGYGLQWFRQWKAPQRSDWECYAAQLALPLSPSRAKGIGIFNREGRELAGFDPEFIDELEVYARSKGRTPNVYYFNPQAEWSIATGEVALPQGPLAMLAEDLSALTLYLGRHDDVAIMARKPERAFLRKLGEVGIRLPEIQEMGALDLEERKLCELRPWAWSPDSHAFLTPFFNQTYQRETGWNETWKELHSKVFSAGLLDSDSVVCHTVAEVADAGRRLGVPLVFKSPFGLAGKGLRICQKESLVDASQEWARTILAREGAVIVEPWLDRVFDFSVQYEVLADGKMRLLGYTRMHNDPKGKFRACSMRRTLTEQCEEPDLNRFFYGRDRALQRTYEDTLPRCLEPHLTRLGYRGPLGVDALIHRDGDGTLVHRPVVEINPRFTMGRVCVELAGRVVKGQPLTFHILTSKHLRVAKFPDLLALARALEARYPVQLNHYQNNHRRIQSGCLILNDPEHVRGYLAVLQVGKHHDPTLL